MRFDIHHDDTKFFMISAAPQTQILDSLLYTTVIGNLVPVGIRPAASFSRRIHNVQQRGTVLRLPFVDVLLLMSELTDISTERSRHKPSSNHDPTTGDEAYFEQGMSNHWPWEQGLRRNKES
ncbi:hypothetical protein AVEN_96964-1 [Araneus ventricosus]|uniref:Uncharacterized protein n=1 Tax=Araneus ventricosus TaxID=182803 RepID=A0A4Y2TYA4_ARAVE|nr:hypothetical protein AVEN_96964-1 [Araneus ventricosus]